MSLRPGDVLLRTPWGGPWRAFRDPVAIVTTTHLEEIPECLGRVDDRVRSQGLYAAGFVTYEAAGAFGLPVHASAPQSLPLLWFGLYLAERVTAEGRPRVAGRYTTGAWQPTLDRDAYLRAVDRIKAEIEAGHTYQINLTFLLRSTWSGDPLALLADLDAAQAGQWGGAVHTGRHIVCSASPELFFRRRGRRIECRPMKGTIARGLWPEADVRQAEALRRSEKDRAENVMIVDMVRNDLGRLAATGSVQVASMFDVERYPRQWQMTSTVAAEVDDARLPRIFESLFPAASITGAPKRRSMEIIRDLESSPRGVYTGTLGYVSPNERAHFSVAIRTVTIDAERGEAEFGVGSGVVWDSRDRDEYDECLLKASILTHVLPPFRLLETIGYAPESGFALLDRHFDRMSASAEYFGLTFDRQEAGRLLAQLVEDLRGPSKVRLLLSREGSLACEAFDLPPDDGRRERRAGFAADPVDPADLFLYHKTTHRDVYERARASRPDLDAVVLWNSHGEVTEAVESNVVALLDGQRVTPPVECGLLAGTLRAELLAQGEIQEAPLTRDDLRRAERVWLINSVRGWMPVTIE